MTKKLFKAGDFTGLAEDYSQSRPDYADSVIRALLATLPHDINASQFCDVGAGTGIFTRMLAQYQPAGLHAVEPNDDMRKHGELDSRNTDIKWVKGNAEKTGFDDNLFDLVTMASSFHWADTQAALTEFRRILKTGGRFAALWNPRLIEVNPLLVEIEDYLKSLGPEIKRVSSGRSGITGQLNEILWQRDDFDDTMYLEGRHTITMSKQRYLSAWRSVNDLQVQLGPDRFSQFISFVEDKLSTVEYIDATYLTRAWSARACES